MKTIVTLAGLLLTLPVLADGTSMQLSFAEPGSGEKVSEYTVKLPMNRQEEQEFLIPADCPGVLAARSMGADRWGSRIDRTLWAKVANDCDYYEFIRAYQRPVEHDYVSGYDFRNASFSDFPLASGCPEGVSGTAPPGCAPMPPGFTDFTRLIPFRDSQAAPPGLDQICRIEEGVFRGYLSQGPGGMRCIPARHHHAPGFRLLSVAFADVNLDGYQDAVLRLVPLGRGVSRTPILLPLTRYSEAGSLVVPQIAPSAQPAMMSRP